MITKSNFFALVSIVPLVSALTAACSGASDPLASTGTDDEELRSGRACMYDGKRHKVGESFPSSDGCNTCSCTKSGVICTARACAIDAGPPVCTYDGKTYQDGQSFPSSDGCNTCSCNGGQVLCTKRACQIDCTAPNACSGPAPGMPNVLCADGTVGGPVCAPSSTGTCGWTIRTCACTDANGTSHKAGDTWSDGCNTCSCDSQGRAACTARMCACPPNGTIDCMPPVSPANASTCSGPYHQWVVANCPGVSFVY